MHCLCLNYRCKDEGKVKEVEVKCGGIPTSFTITPFKYDFVLHMKDLLIEEIGYHDGIPKLDYFDFEKLIKKFKNNDKKTYYYHSKETFIASDQLIILSDLMKDTFTPINTPIGGNSFWNAISIALCGTEEHMMALRVLTAYGLIQNKKKFASGKADRCSSSRWPSSDIIHRLIKYKSNYFASKAWYPENFLNDDSKSDSNDSVPSYCSILIDALIEKDDKMCNK